jgi:thiamine-phosphate pyrophosphorylase
LDYFTEIGTSVHSTEDALLACRLGATYLTAGHIFETDCKKGLPGRGLTFLKNVCDSVSVPVYGIGGITPENLEQVMETGATGGCMMSLAMKK